MQIPWIALIVAAEIYLVLIILIAVLLWFSKRQKSWINQLEDSQSPHKSLLNDNDHKNTFDNKSYNDYLINHLHQTRLTSLQLGERAGISDLHNNIVSQSVLLSADPQDLAVLLREIFLNAEIAGNSQHEENPFISSDFWLRFSEPLEPLLSLIAQDENVELETLRQRVANLEKFKDLFFELEKKWLALQNKQNDLSSIIQKVVSNEVDINELSSYFSDYQAAYKDLTPLFTECSSTFASPAHNIHIIEKRGPTRELLELRSLTDEQHRIIYNLQKKIKNSSTDHDRLAMHEELVTQLQQQTRFLKESDACIKLLEDELALANEKINHLVAQSNEETQLKIENAELKATVDGFIHDNKTVIKSLSEQLQFSDNSEIKYNDDIAINQELEETKAALTHLRKQYADLESRYLELRI